MNRHLHLIQGPQGPGKAAYIRKLAAELPGLRLCLDEWMGGLFVPDLTSDCDAVWLAARIARCHDLMWQMAAQSIVAGSAVVMDLGAQADLSEQGLRPRLASFPGGVMFHVADGPPADPWRNVRCQSEPAVGEGATGCSTSLLDEEAAAHAMALLR